jgi:hypothetical protein
LKNIYLLLTLIVFSCVDDAPEPVPIKVVRFSTQAEIDNFQNNYPGSKILNWEIWIEGNDIANLHGLSTITQIEESLHINASDLLINLEGLEGITSIGGGLYIDAISDNAPLNSLKGLENLKTIGNGLSITGLPVLKDVKGLQNLISTGHGLEIRNNYLLSDLTGLGNLKSVGNGFISIKANDALTSLAGLENLDDGTLNFIEITYNKLLSSCDIQLICDHLASPNVDINIHDNAEGCNNQQEVAAACGTGL